MRLQDGHAQRAVDHQSTASWRLHDALMEYQWLGKV
jgi:hypothetical protein